MFRPFIPALLLILPGLVGCGNGDSGEPASTEPPPPAVEGLSPEQIESRAEPMSQEEAARRGIIDTTIHLERHISEEDTLLTPDAVARPDTTLP